MIPLPMDEASRTGDIKTLNRLHYDGYYTRDALANATRENRTDVLTWWKDSNLQLKVPLYLDSPLQTITIPTEIAPETFRWWHESGLVPWLARPTQGDIDVLFQRNQNAIVDNLRAALPQVIVDQILWDAAGAHARLFRSDRVSQIENFSGVMLRLSRPNGLLV